MNAPPIKMKSNYKVSELPFELLVIEIMINSIFEQLTDLACAVYDIGEKYGEGDQ